MPRSSNPKTYVAAGTIAANTLVIIDSAGKVVANGLAGVFIGWVEQAAVSGDLVAVYHRNTPGTAMLTVSKAVAAGAPLYAAASGKLTDSSSSAGNIIAYANEAGSADGSVIEVTLTGPGAG